MRFYSRKGAGTCRNRSAIKLDNKMLDHAFSHQRRCHLRERIIIQPFLATCDGQSLTSRYLLPDTYMSRPRLMMVEICRCLPGMLIETNVRGMNTPELKRSTRTRYFCDVSHSGHKVNDHIAVLVSFSKLRDRLIRLRVYKTHDPDLEVEYITVISVYAVFINPQTSRPVWSTYMKSNVKAPRNCERRIITRDMESFSHASPGAGRSITWRTLIQGTDQLHE